MASGILGMDELLGALRELPEDLQRKVLASWTSRYATRTATAARARAPLGLTGNLRAGTVARRSRPATLRKLHSVARSVVIGKRPASQFHIINRGTGERIGGPKSKRYKGRRFGRIAANPFLEQAAAPLLAEARGDINSGLAREVQRLLDRAAKRTHKRGGVG